MLGRVDGLRNNLRAHSVVPSQMTRSLPETVQLCADTEKTAVPAALKSRISEYRNRQPIVFFLELPDLTFVVVKMRRD